MLIICLSYTVDIPWICLSLFICVNWVHLVGGILQCSQENKLNTRLSKIQPTILLQRLQENSLYIISKIYAGIWVDSMGSIYHNKKECTLLAAASDKVYQLLAHGQWLSPGPPASSITKTGRHDIAEILLKVVLNIHKINQPYTTNNIHWIQRRAARFSTGNYKSREDGSVTKM